MPWLRYQPTCKIRRALLHDMIGHWRSGDKVVIAARRKRDDPFPSSLVSDLFYFLFRRLAVKSMPARGFDFWLIDRQVRDLINGIQESNVYLAGLIMWLGFEPRVVHYDRQARPQKYGRSMWTFTRKLKYFIDTFVAFSYFPVRLATGLGALFSLLGLIYGAWVIYARLALDVDAEGWASLMIVVLIAAGVQLLILGVIGEYLWRSLDETRRRPRFIIDRIIRSETETEATDMNIYGIAPPMATPFAADESIDEAALRAEVRYLIESGGRAWRGGGRQHRRGTYAFNGRIAPRRGQRLRCGGWARAGHRRSHRRQHPPSHRKSARPGRPGCGCAASHAGALSLPPGR